MSYAGDVTCQECWSALESQTDSQLVDVRTAAEWAFVGVPDLSPVSKQVLTAEWQKYPDMSIDMNFVSNVAELLAGRDSGQEASVYMLCRSGVRSIAAAEALTRAGYTRVFNVLGGFEGGHDENGHRGSVSGWKSDGLPWRQS